MQQHFYIYPENLAQEAKKTLLSKSWGWSEQDFANYLELAQVLETNLNNIGTTLVSCFWRTQGKYKTEYKTGKPKTVWNIKISTPGHCDIFQLLNTIRLTFDLDGIDDKFTFIETSLDNKEVYIEFTVCC